MEEAFENMSISGEELSVLTKTAELTKDSVTGTMSKAEIEQHLQLCMKLSAENKINSKNAFGLHLIGLLRGLVKDKNTDLQFASLSLQASSKIYSGRVDALYRETFQFHNHLQTILSGGKKDARSDNQDADGDFSEGDAPTSGKGKTSQKKKFKSYVTTEDNISLSSQADNIITKPHGNFELVKSAFSGSSTVKKLLNYLKFENDSCEISCARSSKIYKVKKPVSVSKYILTNSEKILLEKTTKISEEIDVLRPESFGMPRNTLLALDKSLPVGLDESFQADLESANSDFSVNSPVGLEMYTDDDSLVIGSDNLPVPKESGNGLHILNERFCALDITVGSFVKDISQAVARDGSINPALLPPQSALRKVLKTSEKSNFRKDAPTEKKKKEIKSREPFFRGQTVDTTLFAPGKKTVLSETTIANWDRSDTTNLGTGFDEFNSELNADICSESRQEIIEEEFLEIPYTVMAATDPHFVLKNSFLKRKNVWQLCRDNRLPVAAQKQNASPGIFSRVGSMVPQPEQLVESFRNLTLNESFEGDNADISVAADISVGTEEQVTLSDFADDIQLMLVTPPELVKPLNVRPQQKAMNFDTQKVKQNLLDIISTQLETRDSVMFSALCDQLNKEAKSKDADNTDDISWQFAFVMLLVLANEKVLLLENIDDGKDLIITKDVSEIDVSS